MKKIVAAMTRPQRALTAVAFVFALLCALAIAILAFENLSGRLDHIENPDFCGSVVINELPERLMPESNPILASFDVGQGAPYSCQLSLSYDELSYWLSTPLSLHNWPMVVSIDLSEQHLLGFNIVDKRAELRTMGTGEFYVVIDHSVVKEMYQLLKGTDEAYTFEVKLSPINFNSAELALRSALNSLWRRYGCLAGNVVLASCVALGFLGFSIIRLWKREIYYPVRFDVALFEEEGEDRPGRWD